VGQRTEPLSLSLSLSGQRTIGTSQKLAHELLARPLGDVDRVPGGGGGGEGEGGGGGGPVPNFLRTRSGGGDACV
jgi:hypothetical protein